MKNKLFVAGILAMVLVFGMTVIGCPPDDNGNGGNGGGDPTSVTYTSYDSDGNVYALVVTKDANRAVYTPQVGDSYVLTIKDETGAEIGKSTGAVKAVITGGFTLEKGGNEFSVVVSGNTISTLTNNIPLDDGTTRTPPTSLSPNKPEKPSIGFTLTDIPSQYNGKYATLADGQVGKINQLDCGSYGTYVQISNGRVTLPVFGGEPIEGGTYSTNNIYMGTGTGWVFVTIHNENNSSNNPSLTNRRFDPVAFSNGSVTKSWNDGTGQ
jgi:hypothetical protein